MKISEHFDLDATQFTLDFVDINTEHDMPLFIDPFYMGLRTDAWSTGASRTLRNFFETFVSLVRDGREKEAQELFQHLHEPNETCLGLSKDKPRGNAIGDVDGRKLYDSIANSRAVQTGIVEDIEDFRLFIPGIDKDKISDMTTNVIRRHLIDYTKNQCKLWGVDLTPGVQTGPFWNPANRRWENGFDDMLVVDGKKILLTPKGIVSYCKRYTPQKYHKKFILEFLQHEHIKIGSALVQKRKDGTPFVTKLSLEEEAAPFSKEFLANFTAAHPAVFKEFRAWSKRTSSAISNEDLSSERIEDVALYLKTRLQSIKPGNNGATDYHRTSVSILELLFYPHAISPTVEKEIHEGRKRIDITFDNAAQNGFFYRLHSTYQTPAQFIFVECKNYSKDVNNPELDQLAGRFSVNRGKFGLLLCRTVNNMTLLLRRCADAYTDGRGIMLPVTDEDLVIMLDQIINGISQPHETFLSDRYREIALT